MENKNWNHRASVSRKQDVIFIYAQSGKFGTGADHDAFSVAIRAPWSEEILGRSLRRALSASRYIKEGVNEFVFKESVVRHGQWQAEAMQLFGCRSEREFYSDYKSVSVDLDKSEISLHPFRQLKPGSWTMDGVAPADVQRVSVEASDAELGRALLVALDRSKS